MIIAYWLYWLGDRIFQESSLGSAIAILEKEGIHCNSILVFGLHQAIAGAEAGVTRISLLVGRILDWYKQEGIRDNFYPDEDPGVFAMTCIYNYSFFLGVTQ